MGNWLSIFDHARLKFQRLRSLPLFFFFFFDHFDSLLLACWLPGQLGKSAMSYSHGFASGTDVPIEHLDFGYINNCRNASYMEKIVKILRYGMFVLSGVKVKKNL